MNPARTLGVSYLKLENFEGSNFNAWRRKVIFGMQLLKIYYVVSEEKPDFEKDSESEASWTKDDHSCRSYLLNFLGDHLVASWAKDDYFCRSYLLNLLADHLTDAYTNKPSAKEIWNALEEQYKDEEKLGKSHLIDKFFDFKFEDDTEALPQVKKLENLVMKLNDEKIDLCQSFISGAIANKLSLSWMSFSTNIQRRKRQVTLVGG
ncbi:uncharacterized protein LOC109841943 [Asparagus officinalis]|uniref:uncharacterized protein LOC109841943 n=1 Tax=Asparagus officinalis TaxID=4686 RepID=UPI00098E7710|nr:uncharacterized protein LOC109841943 [Asparagus officinalis]